MIHEARRENFGTTTLVLRQLVLQTHRETQRVRVTFELPAVSYPARTAHHHLKPMKNDLTLDHVKEEARALLRGLQRRDPEALRRCKAIDPLADTANPALDYARFIIARERGFTSWRKLKEHIENLRR